MNKNIDIGGRLHSTATGNIVTGANEVFDDDKNKKQSEINTETYTLVNEINAKLDGLSPEQQGALDVATKANKNEANLSYYVCGTEENIAAKVISDATGYILSKGGSIKVKMTNANTAANATLNINSTGAKPLYYDGKRASANNSWEAGETVEVYYDETSYYANNVAGSSKFVTGEKVNEVGIDDEPTAESDNLVKSGGVAQIVKPNLFYSKEFLDGYINDSNNTITPPGGSGLTEEKYCPDYIPTNGNRDYNLTLITELGNINVTSWMRMAFYDASKNLLQGKSYVVDTYENVGGKRVIQTTFKAPAKARFMRISFRSLTGEGYDCKLYTNSLPNKVNENGQTTYIVGEGYYESIQDACDAADAGDIVFIKNGTYTEQVSIWGKSLNLIGENRETTILIDHSGFYDTPPLEMNLGSLSNMTIIEDGSNPPAASDPTKDMFAYCLHIEYPSSGEFNINNCTFINYAHTPLGCGLRQDYTVNIDNCIFDCRAGNEGSSKERGAFFVHCVDADNATNQHINVNNCLIISDNETYAITIGVPNNAHSGYADARFTNCNIQNKNTGISDSVVYWAINGNREVFHIVNSYGNTVSALNTTDVKNDLDSFKSLVLNTPDNDIHTRETAVPHLTERYTYNDGEEGSEDITNCIKVELPSSPKQLGMIYNGVFRQFNYTETEIIVQPWHGLFFNLETNTLVDAVVSPTGALANYNKRIIMLFYNDNGYVKGEWEKFVIQQKNDKTIGDAAVTIISPRVECDDELTLVKSGTNIIVTLPTTRKAINYMIGGVWKAFNYTTTTITVPSDKALILNYQTMKFDVVNVNQNLDTPLANCKYKYYILFFNDNGYPKGEWVKYFMRDQLKKYTDDSVLFANACVNKTRFTISSRQNELNGYPENSLVGLYEIYKKGYKAVRVSVRWTSDNVPVLEHDDDISRVARNADGTSITSGTVYVKDSTYQQLLNYDFGIKYGSQFAGTKIAKLEDYLKKASMLGIYVMIELKRANPSNPAIDNTTAAILNNLFITTGMVGKVGIFEGADLATDAIVTMKAINPYIDLGWIPSKNAMSTEAQKTYMLEKMALCKTDNNKAFFVLDGYAGSGAPQQADIIKALLEDMSFRQSLISLGGLIYLAGGVISGYDNLVANMTLGCEWLEVANVEYPDYKLVNDALSN